MNATVTAKAKTSPEVTRYLNVAEYLGAYYLWRKGQASGFSFACWAQELGFRSRSFLRFLLIGKRSITAKSLPLFVRGLRLGHKDAEHFERLVLLSQAPTAERRERILRELLDTRVKPSQWVEIQDHFEFVSSPIAPRLHVLLTFNDIEKTPSALADLIGIPAAQVQKLLLILERLKLAREEDPGRGKWTALVGRFKVNDSLGDIGLQAFHRKSLGEAIEAIDLSPETRHFQCLLFPLSKDEYLRAKGEICEAMERILTRYASDSGSDRRLYQLNFNLIPVSKPILRERESVRVPVGVSHVVKEGLSPSERIAT